MQAYSEQGWGILLGPELPGDYHGVATFNLKPQRDLVISDLPEDLIDYIFKLAELHKAEGTADRVRCAAVCREWASILSAPVYWRELQLDTADFDGLRRRRRRRLRRYSSSSRHYLDRTPAADAGARAAFADALLTLAQRAGGALERVRVVSARASGSFDAAGGRNGGGGPLRHGGGAFALLDDEAEEELVVEEGEEEEDERGAGTSRRSAAPRLFYGDGVSLEPFPGARVGFCGAGRELEVWLSATANKLAALSLRSGGFGGGGAAAAGGGGGDGTDFVDDSDDSFIAAVGVFGAGDADALARAERARAEAAAHRERLGASARLQAALCGKPFGGKARIPSGSGGGGRRYGRRRIGGLGGRGAPLLFDGSRESLASWVFRVAAYLCFRAIRGALRGVLRWRRRGFGTQSVHYYSSYSSSCPGSAAIDGALTLAAVMLAARLLVAAFALPALAVTAAKGALSLLP